MESFTVCFRMTRFCKTFLLYLSEKNIILKKWNKSETVKCFQVWYHQVPLVAEHQWKFLWSFVFQIALFSFCHCHHFLTVLLLFYLIYGCSLPVLSSSDKYSFLTKWNHLQQNHVFRKVPVRWTFLELCFSIFSTLHTWGGECKIWMTLRSHINRKIY